MDPNLSRVLNHLNLQEIDIFTNSYYSFIFLKKNFDKISKLNSNSIPIRYITVCKDMDQYNSIVDYFKPYKNIIIKNLLSSFESSDHFIVIIVNKTRIYYLNIEYDNLQRTFYSKLSDSIDSNNASFFYTFYDYMWDTIEKNIMLEKRNIFQQDFVDISSHQLRNPILPIIGFSKTLKSKINDTEMLEYLDIIIKNAEKLKNIANEILDISKIEANPSKLDIEVFDINDLLDSIVKDYNQLANKDSSGISVIFQGKPNMVIEADKEYIKQALENILNNSYFFTKKNEGNKIMISVIQKSNTENYATIILEDEGPGVLDDDPDRIFTKFYPNSGGAGLGLFISKKIIEIHGGRIMVENRVNDMGVKFSINIPIKRTEFDYLQSQNNKLTKATKILIINEYTEDMKSINDQLKKLGYNIDHFEDPYNAIESFTSGKYSKVFIGVNVNGLDGFDLYDDLKKRDKNIEGYFISSNRINKEAMEFLNKNLLYDHFIYNPISLTDILKIIQRE